MPTTMHLCFAPITKEGKLSAKTILGNQRSLSEWQSAYHAHMSAQWPELERGESSMITKRKHIPTWLFKLGGRLDKQHNEIVKALSDINAFNAGKKRDKALALLSAWLPDMEKFSREIKKQSDYIDSLKQRAGQAEKYADHLREGRYGKKGHAPKDTGAGSLFGHRRYAGGVYLPVGERGAAGKSPCSHL